MQRVNKYLGSSPVERNIFKTRARSSYDTCDEVGRTKNSYGMSFSKILRINRLIQKENQRLNADRDLK